MFYKGIIKANNKVFVANNKKKLASEMRVVVATVSRGLDGFNSPHYEFSIIPEEEYLQILKIQKNHTILESIPNSLLKNNLSIFKFANILKNERIKELTKIKELYKDDLKTMQNELAQARLALYIQKMQNYTFMWCELNNNYKKI
jgi:hypothetical protein